MANAKADVVVIGAGAFGVWTALTLVERGATVILIDSYGPGNLWGSSGGESRNIRSAYGDREVYTRWSIRAWAMWQAREQALGVRWLYPSGALRTLGPTDRAPQCAMFEKLGHPHEMLTSDEVRARWPQVRYTDEPHILYEPQAGTIAARDALVGLVQDFQSKGGIVMRARVRPPPSIGARLIAVDADGAQIAAGDFIFACGPWLPRLFPGLLGRYIKTPRRELFFLAPLPGDRRFEWDQCPSLADKRGWTSSDIGGGVKIAPVIRHVPMDPDDGNRMPTPALRDQANAYAALRLPGLSGRPVIATYVSQLENSDNEHFIIDQHPNLANVVIAGGGSGHAYKMGPVIGEHVAALVLDGRQDAALAAMFGLAAHGPVGAGEGG